MTPTFSILHASYGRPAKAVLAMERWLNNAAWTPKLRDTIQYIFALNDDDPTASNLRTMADCAAAKHLLDVVYVTGPFPGSAPAWDAAAKASTGRLLIQAQDDLLCPPNWNAALLWAGPWDAEAAAPTVIAVSDGYRKDALQTVAICNRARYEQQGHFLFDGYQSMFSDDEFTYAALRDARDGKATLIEARDLVFKHENPYHTGAPQDAVFLRQNSAEAYAQGAALFAQRNPEAAASGLITWR